MSKIILKIISIFVTCFLLFNYAGAEENSDYTEKAKERRYVGGADESDLKVQKSVVKNTNSNAKIKSEDPDDANEGF